MNLRSSLEEILAREPYRSILIGIVFFLFSFYLFSHKYAWPATPDERSYLTWSFNIFKFGEYMNVYGVPITTVPPLYCYLLALSFKLLGPSLDSAQLVGILFGALCSPLAFFMGKHLYDERVGIISGIFTATSYLIWVYSIRTISEIVLIFFVNLSILFLYLTLEKGTKRYPILLGVSLGLGYLTKELIVFLSPLLLLILYEKNHNVRTRIRNFCLCGVSGAVVIAPWWYRVSTTAPQKVLGGITGRTGAGGFFTSWGFRGSEEVVSIFTFEGRISMLVLILFYIGVLFAVRRYWNHRKMPDKVLVLSVVSWFFLFTFNTIMPVQERRLVPMLIPFYILSSRALTGLYRRMKKIEVAVEKTIPLTFILIIILFSYWNTGLSLNEWGKFRFSSFTQENEIDYLKETLFLEDCNLFSSRYDKDEVVGSSFAYLFYFYTEGQCVSYRLRMENLSDMASETIIYKYNPQKGISEEILLRQISEDNISIVLVLAERNVVTLVEYLRSKPSIFTERTGDGYKATFVFEVNREELEEYLESLCS
ncbi:MAG: glycosyltransferase family 39 protein [Theionarchaea archaeon]|nr:MAG: hypothetical protein AYK19_20210 [Theionarchaea archaeon DG-70-1]MBU7028970.1 glycosyltransferase family 39 protein [Theionarchaea archaeon]